MTEPIACEAPVDPEWQEHKKRIATLAEKGKPVYLIAAAGCGKTQLIADAVEFLTTQPNEKGKPCRELILTHTHAGVDALRSRIRKKEVPAKNYHIDTIAGWALRYASSFPRLSGLLDDPGVEQKKDTSDRLIFMASNNEGWRRVYEAATHLLTKSAIREIVQISYTGLFVDEYQDCTIAQHDLILQLAELLPCRVLGDPLQGIFDFSRKRLLDRDRLVNWDRDLPDHFHRLPELKDPKRWKQNGAEPELGEWLAKVRDCLDADHPIDLNNLPKCVFRKDLNGSNHGARMYSICRYSRCNPDERTVAMLKMRSQCYKLAQKLGGHFSCVEAMDCEDLRHGAERIEKAEGPKRAAEVIKFAEKCMTKTATELRSFKKAFSKGESPKNSNGRHPAQYRALSIVAESSSLEPVADALESLRALQGAKVFRKELLAEMYRALREFQTRDHETLKDAAWFIRNQTRQLGRTLHKRTLGTTLLLKGLEFDHVIVLDADQLDKKNLYVALTRAKKSLTILSAAPQLKPRDRESNKSGPSTSSGKKNGVPDAQTCLWGCDARSD